MSSAGYDVDPRQAVLPAEILNGSIIEADAARTVSIIGETLLAGAGGAQELSRLEVPILNALGLGRGEMGLGRAALLESVAAPAFSQGTFARAMHSLTNKLDAITGVGSADPSMVTTRGSGKGTTYRLSDNIVFADGVDQIEWLVDQARTETVLVSGIEEAVVRFPARGMREVVFSSLLEEYDRRPLILTRVAELLKGRMYEVSESTGVRLIKYPRLDEQREKDLLVGIERGLLAYTGLSGGSQEQNTAAIEGAVLCYNELVFHFQYIAAAAAKKFAGRAPFDTLYQEANMAIMRTLKRYELRSPESGPGVTSYVSVSVNRQLRQVLAEDFGVVRTAHSAIEALSDLKAWENRFAYENHRWPTPDDIEHGLRISGERLRELRLLDRLTPTSIASTSQSVEIGLEPTARDSRPFDEALLDRWSVREPLDSLMASSTLSDAQKVILSLIYGVHFPQLAGIAVQRFTYPFAPKYMPVPDEGIFTPTAAGKILGMNMSAVSAMHNRALAQARQFLQELGLTSAADVYAVKE